MKLIQKCLMKFEYFHFCMIKSCLMFYYCSSCFIFKNFCVLFTLTSIVVLPLIHRLAIVPVLCPGIFCNHIWMLPLCNWAKRVKNILTKLLKMAKNEGWFFCSECKECIKVLHVLFLLLLLYNTSLLCNPTVYCEDSMTQQN